MWMWRALQWRSSMSFGKTELNYINDPLAAGQFVDMLLPIFKKKVLNPVGCLEALYIIKGILPVLGVKMTGKILIAVNPLLVYSGLDLRLGICDILDGLSLIDSSLVFLARLLRELNALSCSEMNEFDYDTRINAYNSLSPDTFSSFKEEHALTVLSHCMYDMSSEELILRQSASKSLLSFVQFAASVLDNNGEDCEEMLSHDQDTRDGVPEITNKSDSWTKACIQRIIKKTFLQNISEAMSKDTSIQKEWIALLRDMIYRLHPVPALNSFRDLCSKDPEVDFFNNIVHLQIHRRGRALSRFSCAVSSGILAESITVKIFLPLFFNMMLDVKDGKGEHLRNACSATLASISGQMQWDNYRSFLMRCFKEMKLKPDKGKIMIRLICDVLDNFHFRNAEKNLSVPFEIQVCLQKQVFPKVVKLLKLDSEKVNVNVSLAALKLLKLLPEETKEAQLTRLMQSCLKMLIVLLRSTEISLSHAQLRILIQFPMFIDLATNPSPVALSLLKSIIGRKLVVHEIYDIVLPVAELMVTSQSEPIRKKCSQILLQFLLDYQVSDKRLQQHIDFLLKNLDYEHSSGREAVLEMLHPILIKFPKSVVDSQAQTFFVRLVVALANERDQKVQSMVSTVLRELITRTSPHSVNLILDYSLSWYMGGDRHLWSAAAQVTSSFWYMLMHHASGILHVSY